MIIREQQENTAVITLDNGKVNALSQPLLEALGNMLSQIEHQETRAVVLTGKGTTFSAGVDLFSVFGGSKAQMDRFLATLKSVLLHLFTFRKPVVAAINGHAIAGGCLLAAACDYCVMAGGAGKIGVTEMLLGIPFPTIAFEIMRARVAPQHLQSAIYSGATYSPEEALARGFIDEVVAAEAVRDRALSAARQIGAIPPATFALTKRQLRQPVLDRIERYEKDFSKEYTAIWQRDETSAAVQAYIAKITGKPAKK